MIDLFYWNSPNLHKVTILLEEIGANYRLIPLNPGNGDQFSSAFLKVSPNAKMPAIIDHAPAGQEEPLSIFESGAIMLYLAEKSGRFLPADPAGRAKIMQWVFWQVGGLGPNSGQNLHFRHFAHDRQPYAIDRFTKETGRLFAVLDIALSGGSYLAGAYSIADMAAFPWVKLHTRLGLDIADFPHVARWLEEIAARPAVQRAYALVTPENSLSGERTEQQRRILFGQSADTVRQAFANAFEDTTSSANAKP